VTVSTRTAIVNITNRCNQRCTFCLEGGAREGRPEATTAEVLAELDGLWARGARHVTFMGAESLLRPDIGRVLEHARERGFTRIAVATNGTPLARPGFVAELVARGLEVVELSIHAHTPALAAAISRVPTTHARQVEALRHLDAAAVPVILNLVVCRENREHVLDVVQFVRARLARAALRVKLKLVSLQGFALAAARRQEALRLDDVDAVALGDFLAGAGLAFWYYNFPLCRLGGHAWRAQELLTLVADEQYFDRNLRESRYFDSGHQLTDRCWPAASCGTCTLRAVCPGIEREYVRVHRTAPGLAEQEADPLPLVERALGDAGLDPALAAERLAALAAQPRPPEPEPERGGAASCGGGRLHVSLGAVCNNNCVFCHEGDRDARRLNNSAMTPERVRWMLERHRGAEEVCFTSGEPTTNPHLREYVGWSRELGYGRISLMTNGRRLGYRAYAAALIRAGLNRVYISIHGHTAALHDGLTRTPGSFAQTLAGLDVVAGLRRRGVELHSSTVLTRRNLPHLLEIHRFLGAHGVDQVVFNVLQPLGRADRFFEQLAPRYAAVAAAFRALLDAGAARPPAFLVDIPPCATEGVPDRNRGWVERYEHYDLAAAATLPAARLPERQASGDGAGLARVTRADLDAVGRAKRDRCSACRYASRCDGVWINYLQRFGWDDLEPVPEHGQGAADRR
jgi:cyclic pyranopterin phosphate synthase